MVWKPQGPPAPLALPPEVKLARAERTPLVAGEPEALSLTGLEVTDAPLFLWLQR